MIMESDDMTEQEKDLRSIVESDFDFSDFRDTCIFITGATGLIGSMLVKFFLYCNKEFIESKKNIAIQLLESEKRNY